MPEVICPSERVSQTLPVTWSDNKNFSKVSALVVNTDVFHLYHHNKKTKKISLHLRHRLPTYFLNNTISQKKVKKKFFDLPKTRMSKQHTRHHIDIVINTRQEITVHHILSMNCSPINPHDVWRVASQVPAFYLCRAYECTDDPPRTLHLCGRRVGREETSRGILAALAAPNTHIPHEKQWLEGAGGRARNPSASLPSRPKTCLTFR